MKKFCKNLFCFSLIFLIPIILVVCFDFFVIGNQYQDYYQGTLTDKVDHLTSTEAPRLILLGNSNVYLGVSSPMVEEAIGMPVVNMSLPGNMGMPFIEDVTKRYLQEGDIIVLCHTNFSGGTKLEYPLYLWSTVEKNVRFWPLLLPYLDQMILAYPEYFYHAFSRWLSADSDTMSQPLQLRTHFNEYGDCMVRPSSLQRTPEELFPADGTYTPPEISKDFVARINAFHEFALQRGATLLFAACPFGDVPGAVPEEYAAFTQELADQLDCPVISNYEDYLFSPDLFFDSPRHLTADGTILRTNQLIEDLQGYFSSDSAQ